MKILVAVLALAISSITLGVIKTLYYTGDVQDTSLNPLIPTADYEVKENVM